MIQYQTRIRASTIAEIRILPGRSGSWEGDLILIRGTLLVGSGSAGLLLPETQYTLALTGCNAETIKEKNMNTHYIKIYLFIKVFVEKCMYIIRSILPQYKGFNGMNKISTSIIVGSRDCCTQDDKITR